MDEATVTTLTTLLLFSRVCLGASYAKPALNSIPFDDTRERPTITNSSVPTIAQAKYYAHLTAAVYCIDPELSNWTCRSCKAAGPNVKLVSVIQNKDSIARAIVTSNSVAKELLLVFRWVVSMQDLLLDETIRMQRANVHGDAIKVNKGAWAAMNSLYAQVTQILMNELKKTQKYNIVLAGHCLGGMLASAFLYALRDSKEFKNLPYALYTYGTPRVGNSGFAHWMNSQTFKIVRVVNKGDMVPHVVTPHSLWYAHCNTELWINGSGQDILFQENNRGSEMLKFNGTGL